LSPIDLTSPMKVVDGAFFWASSKALLKFHSGRPLSRAPPPLACALPPHVDAPGLLKGFKMHIRTIVILVFFWTNYGHLKIAIWHLETASLYAAAV
jgi:hypothetical protein